MNTINIDSYKVEANDSVICGNNNVVFGNNNKIYGNSNKVYGNNNAVIGNDNIVKGEDNKAEGTGNEVSTPFGSFASAPSTSTPASQPAISRDAPMNSYPTTGRARSATFPITPPTNYPVATSPTPYSNAMIPANYAVAPYVPQGYSQAIVPVGMPQQAYPMVPYINPFTGPTQIPVSTPNPFEAYKSKEKEVDLIQDGTMVFMIKEWESDYIREFCQLVAMNSGQKVGWHVSCGRTCIVGLGDLEKIRQAIIDLLPQLNMRLREWSWNSFGNKVCSDKEVFEKRLFKEYKKEDVEVWRNNPAPSASKAAA